MTIQAAHGRPRRKTAGSVFRVVVLHDEHIPARRGALVAQAVADEMGFNDGYETAHWSTELLGTLFGHVAAMEASTADIVIVTLRNAAGFSLDLRTWLGRWIWQKKDDFTALIMAFEEKTEPGVSKARTFVESAARSTGRDFFIQPAGWPLPGEEKEFFLVM